MIVNFVREFYAKCNRTVVHTSSMPLLRSTPQRQKDSCFDLVSSLRFDTHGLRPPNAPREMHFGGYDRGILTAHYRRFRPVYGFFGRRRHARFRHCCQKIILQLVTL